MITKRFALICVPIVMAGVSASVGSAWADPLPAGATPVLVTAGDTATVNAQLDSGASISGTIGFAGDEGRAFGKVDVYDGSTLVRTVYYGHDHYTVGGLPPSATGYTVCGDAAAYGIPRPTGLLARCYKTALYDGHAAPANATKIPLADGEQRAGVDITMPEGAAISGKVVDTSGTGLSGVDIIAKNLNTGARYRSGTNYVGLYSLAALPPAGGKGYAVCALPHTHAWPTGVRPRCWKNVAWGGGAIPSGATAVSVAAGRTHVGIRITLPPAAAISGKITDAATGHPIANEGVEAFSATGAKLADVLTNSAGYYRLTGLPASSTIRVCANPSGIHRGKCWKFVTWSGGALPWGTRPISTTVGRIHTGINLALGRTTVSPPPAAGSVAGTVTDSTSHDPVKDAYVLLFNGHDGWIAATGTDATGQYSFTNVTPDSTGYLVCVLPLSFVGSASTASPDPGWAPRCHADAAWDGGLDLPSDSMRVPVGAGQHRTGVDIALHPGGTITGTVTDDADTPKPLGGVDVYLYTSSGDYLTYATTSSDGSYSFTGLLPAPSAGYRVCFDGRDATGSVGGYVPECWDNQTWHVGQLSPYYFYDGDPNDV